RVVKAGGRGPLRRQREGTVQAVAESARGAALGLTPGQQYSEATVVIQPGDLWLAYTDGFTEATNRRGKMFGAARLRKQLAAGPAVIRESGDRIVREVLTFLGDQPQSDDMCLVGWGLLDGEVKRTVELRAVAIESSTVAR